MRGIDDIKLTREERMALRTFKSRLKKSLGKKLASILLFGSKARGDFNGDSDVDVYVVVKTKSLEVHKKVASVAADVWDDFGVSLSPVVYSLHEEEKNLAMHSFFFEAVRKEGIAF